ncbi:MAG: ABC transporter ATP-binding protein [Planctomycetota bacterium]|jgi:putative ABC transport system ATP-binding protein
MIPDLNVTCSQDREATDGVRAALNEIPPEGSKPAPRDESKVAVCAEDVHREFGRGTARTPVLSGVDLTVRRGECVYLAGPSGSGKTTLLSILGCILSADRGRVRILDFDVAAMSERQRIELRRDRIGFVFQKFHLVRGLTALDNVTVPLVLRGMSRRAAQRRALPLLETVGLADKARSHPRNLSSGQLQRVALARALVGDPDLILADEPTASLDARNGQEVMGLFKRLTTRLGKTAVVVTHDQRIFHFADRILWLENGRIVDAQNSAYAEVAAEGGSHR